LLKKGQSSIGIRLTDQTRVRSLKIKLKIFSALTPDEKPTNLLELHNLSQKRF
jgi:hypothetical protein